MNNTFQSDTPAGRQVPWRSWIDGGIGGPCGGFLKWWYPNHPKLDYFDIKTHGSRVTTFQETTIWRMLSFSMAGVTHTLDYWSAGQSSPIPLGPWKVCRKMGCGHGLARWMFAKGPVVVLTCFHPGAHSLCAGSVGSHLLGFHLSQHPETGTDHRIVDA